MATSESQIVPARTAAESSLSRAMLALAAVMLAANFLLFSPPRGESYPGAIPWSDVSVLHALTDLFSLYGTASTERGTEIKDFAFHSAACSGLALLAAALFRARGPWPRRRHFTEPWLAAQLLLAGWVLMSAMSRWWAGDPALAEGQAALYFLALAWALGLAWTLEGKDLNRLGAVLVAVSALAGVLCIWYFHERNPYHRPGFPLGNPATLSAALVPAVLLCLAVLAEALRTRLKTGRLDSACLAAGALVALVPLTWCLWLARSRAALVGLGTGLLVILLGHAGRRVRWVLAVAALAVLSLVSTRLLTASRLDTAMGRSATIRFRVYAWRYAAELWGRDWGVTVWGNGAGQYPRLAGQLSLRDRSLDPTAFRGELVEHAHNELFEVLTEIGLVGGVTYVGGLLATVVCGVVLCRLNSNPYRVRDLGLLAGLAALLTDACFSPGLRLAGVPPVFYTLLGMLWASGRTAALPTSSERESTNRTGVRWAAALALLLALLAGWLAQRNWRGVLREESAREAFESGHYEAALRDRLFAVRHVLDPVRQLINDGWSLRGRLMLAEQAAASFLAQTVTPGATRPATTSSVDASRVEAAERRCLETYQEAARLSRRAPTLMYSAAIGAKSAELLARLSAWKGDSEEARGWARRAQEAWREQRIWRPYDFETLLALTQYPASLEYQVGLLRDALRATEAYDRYGRRLSFDEQRVRWLEALQRIGFREGFRETLGQFLALVGPLDPQTDLDTLIASRAPELCRLVAYVEAGYGNHARAAELAGRAAELYVPMRPRFPTLESVALLEQAEFILRGNPLDMEAGQRAADILHKALDRLPVIQQQKYETLAWPYRRTLALALYVAHDKALAVHKLKDALGEEARPGSVLAGECVRLALFDLRAPAEVRPEVSRWLHEAVRLEPGHLRAWGWLAWLAAEGEGAAGVRRVLRDAATHGLQAQDLERIRRSLCQEFPDLCASLSDD